MNSVSKEGFLNVNGTRIKYFMSGGGFPVVQIHGSGFGHGNFAPVTPFISENYLVIDYDQRGYGESDRPSQEYSIEAWADDVAGILDALDISNAHVHGTSMGGMVATVFAGKYPKRTQSVVINCAAARPGYSMQLRLKNYIDLLDIDSRGMESPILAELMAREALSTSYLETPRGRESVATIARIVSASNDVPVFQAACRAIMDMDITGWLPKISSPALVIGGDEDHMTRWDQGPAGVGQQGIYEAIKGAEKYVIHGSAHSSIIDSTEEYLRVVMDFLSRNTPKEG